MASLQVVFGVRQRVEIGLDFSNHQTQGSTVQTRSSCRIRGGVKRRIKDDARVKKERKMVIDTATNGRQFIYSMSTAGQPLAGWLGQCNNAAEKTARATSNLQQNRVKSEGGQLHGCHMPSPSRDRHDTATHDSLIPHLDRFIHLTSSCDPDKHYVEALNPYCRMTELSPPNHIQEPALIAGPTLPSDAPLTNGFAAQAEAPVEDDSTIKCICGYNDDDGLTVYCEDCSTWQHIECYYPNTDVPEVHQCINCQPRHIDVKAAADRQRQSRSAPISGERKQKKAPSKSHKKKTKEPQSATQVNGTSLPDKFGHDRLSGSPHDPPPAKRPKTSHRTSSSTTSIINPLQPNPSRKRTNSVALPRASPTKSPFSPDGPQSPNERFSIEFMQLHDKPWESTDSNVFCSLETTNSLAGWLNDNDLFEKVARGKTQHDVFKRWDKPWSELQSMSPGIVQTRHEDTSVTAHGRHPLYIGLTAQRPADPNSFLGELNGEIAQKAEYEAKSEVWPILRHPEPFVFYSDLLPICIDARKHGSELRYTRRSCQPNSIMQIIIVGQEYRFCLISTRAIQQEEEITIPWYIDPKVMEISKAMVDKKNVSAEDCEYKANWVSGVLAHFGACACNRPKDQCVFNLAGFPRLPVPTQETNGLSTKPPRKKHKKGILQISPLSTGRATNSRAGSEAVNHIDVDDEAVESRSASGSIQSRDITPMAHGTESSIGLGVELSSREQRKIQEQERLFARMEEDRNRRGKRNSAGSALNTPSLSTSVSLPERAPLAVAKSTRQNQLGHLDAFNPSPTSASSASKPRVNGRGSELKIRTTSIAQPANTSAPSTRARRPTVDSSTQTPQIWPPTKEQRKEQLRKHRCTTTLAHKLLKQSRARQALQQSRASSRQNSITSPSIASTSTSAERESAVRIGTPNKDMPPPPLPAHLSKLSTETTQVDIIVGETHEGSKDVEMTDSSALQPELAVETPSESLTELAAKQPVEPVSAPTVKPTVEPSAEAPTRSQEKEKISAEATPLVSSHTQTSEEPKTQQLSAKVESSPPISPIPPAPATFDSASKHTKLNGKDISPKPSSEPSPKPALTVELPPVPVFNSPAFSYKSLDSNKSPTTPSVSVSGPLENHSPTTTHGVAPDTPVLSQSPTLSRTPLNITISSSAITLAAAPTPTKKKMSLSDWSNRNKKKKIEQAQQVAQHSPLSATGPGPLDAVKTPAEEKPDMSPVPSFLPAVSETSQIDEAVKTTDPAPSSAAQPMDNVPSSSTTLPTSDPAAMDVDPKPELEKMPEALSSANTT
ncbi:hypothetical protein BT63DRAFT_451802 [Microthyrium microscopicum]|uniref:SET domain-containing protein n=1 Tax=Microthyrium microscopicum TaxID=703497 RepID=A0A6A6US39_9PEZI|nr:hypothetical protein BT63DRAFT_451802 [Microthyrium microscopicum]